MARVLHFTRFRLLCCLHGAVLFTLSVEQFHKCACPAESGFKIGNESWIFLICIGSVFVWTGLYAKALISGVRRSTADSATGAEKWGGRRFATALVTVVLLNGMLYAVPGRSAKLEPSFLHPPMTSLITNSIAAFHPSHSGSGGAGGVASNEVSNGYLKCFQYPSGNDSEYPFEKDVVYRRPLPYPSSTGHPASSPNVIIFFTEGTYLRD